MFILAGFFFTFSTILFVAGSVFDAAVGGTYNIGLLNVRSNCFISAIGFLISGTIFTCCGIIKEALTSLTFEQSKVVNAISRIGLTSALTSTNTAAFNTPRFVSDVKVKGDARQGIFSPDSVDATLIRAGYSGATGSADPSERFVRRQEHADASNTRTTRGSHRDLVGILQWKLAATGHLLSQSSIDVVELAAENGYQIKYYVGNKITFKKEGYGDRSCYSESDLNILKRIIEEGT